MRSVNGWEFAYISGRQDIEFEFKSPQDIKRGEVVTIQMHIDSPDTSDTRLKGKRNLTILLTP